MQNHASNHFTIEIEDQKFYDELSRTYYEKNVYESVLKSFFDGTNGAGESSPGFSRAEALAVDAVKAHEEKAREFEKNYIYPALAELGYRSPDLYFRWTADFPNYMCEISILRQ